MFPVGRRHHRHRVAVGRERSIEAGSASPISKKIQRLGEQAARVVGEHRGRNPASLAKGDQRPAGQLPAGPDGQPIAEPVVERF